jgi:hypothetical protein
MTGTLNNYSASFCPPILFTDEGVIVLPLCHDAEDY